MDNTTVVVGVLAIVVIGAFVLYRRRAKVDLKGPLGTRLRLDASNDPSPAPPGVSVQGATSRRGGLTAYDHTGRGAAVRDVEVEGDVDVQSKPPSAAPDPKARRPLE